MYGTTIEYWELLLAPLYLLIPIALIFFFPKASERKWFALGMSARLGGAVFYTLIYLFYCQGGDTIAYYATAVPFVNMLAQDPFTGLELLFSSYSVENYSRFNPDTGYPLGYIYSEQDTFMVSRVITPFLFFGFNSYLLGSILIATFSFFGPWKLFQLFLTLAPNAKRIALISALFFPSVVFWGSGIFKDTITYASLCYLVYGFYHTVIRQNISVWRIIFSLITVYFILTIKPYVFLAMLPGALIWYFFRSIQGIQNAFIRIGIIPFIFAISIGLFALTYSYIGE